MKLRILESSDMHGFILPSNYSSREMDLPFGMAKAHQMMEHLTDEAEAAGDIVLKIENGDILQGSALAYYLAKQKANGLSHLTAVTNSFAYDAGLLGNHEFNYGRAYVESYVSQTDYPILCANVLNTSGQPAFGQAYKIFEKNGLKIAVLGLLTQYIPHWEQPSTIQGLSFKSIVETAKEYLPKLREEVDIVVVAYHGGFERALDTGEPEEALTGENEGYQLLTECADLIDAFVTGHQHREIAQHILGVPVVQPGYRAANVAEICLELDDNLKVISSTPKLHSVKDSHVSAEVMSLISPVNEEVENWLDTAMGEVSGDMRIQDANKVRIHEHPYIEFINRVQMESSGAKISGTALFNNEALGFNKIITMRDILTNYIYPNTLAVLRISGADLKNALEISANHLALDDHSGEIIFNPAFVNPKPQYYNYDMYEGIDYTINVSNSFGSKITRLKFEGKPVQPDDKLDIVVNQYRAVGGGNYPMFEASKIISEITVDMTELISEYLKNHPLIEASANHNFIVTK
ncbi:MAG: bifunctional metallophosphatase/5'-nucleotidase [Streptococcaceae bacterium]|jgi:2',3'-cyclic-nucleotide 2'-phosphodiesterase/3'-nucleotidase|nr:bifunctional metallophosphatase/5'-nucleotidase [Streptococcaceae bacterium]